MNQPFFEPWIGERYGVESQFGCRLLLLGESHYGIPDEYEPRFTKRMVQELGIDEQTHKFFNGVYTATTGHPAREATVEDRSRFWHGVAFANFIQEFPSDSWRVRPTTAQWRMARNVLPALVEQMRPDFIVVLGLGVRYWLPDQLSVPWVATKHPSARGFSGAKVFLDVQAALSAFRDKPLR